FAGNIRELCEIARPSVGVVTHIGLAHAEHLGGRAGVARVKGELLAALPADGTAVVNADDDMTPVLVRGCAAHVVRVGFGADPEAGDVRVGAVEIDDELRPSFALDSPWGSARVRLAVRGEHQVVNAGMAAAVALVLGVPLDDVVLGLGEATGASWRMELGHSPAGLTVLNDAYNASPTAVAAALRSFAHLPAQGRHVVVLGEMLELGEHGPAEHERLGQLAGELQLDGVVAVGTAAAPIASGARAAGVDAVVDVATPADALSAVVGLVGPRDAVLVKASRAVGLEVVADALVAGAADGHPRAASQ